MLDTLSSRTSLSSVSNAPSPSNDTAQLYLWQKRTLYIGHLRKSLDVSQGAATLAVALDKPFSFLTKEMNTPIFCTSLIMPAGISVRINTGQALVANCNLDALGCDFLTLFPLAQKHQGQLGFDLSNEKNLILCFLKMIRSHMNSSEAFDHLEGYLNPAKQKANTNKPQKTIEPRIERVIELIQNTVNEHVTGEALAAAVNLSIPRLAQLFKQQTGITIRRYRLWHRLYLTAQYVGKGMNLTDAAIEAGFTDSPHFTHTFRTMLGMTPSDILSQVNKTRIII